MLLNRVVQAKFHGLTSYSKNLRDGTRGTYVESKSGTAPFAAPETTLSDFLNTQKEAPDALHPQVTSKVPRYNIARFRDPQRRQQSCGLRCALASQLPTFQVLGAKHVSNPGLKGATPLDAFYIYIYYNDWPTR